MPAKSTSRQCTCGAGRTNDTRHTIRKLTRWAGVMFCALLIWVQIVVDVAVVVNEVERTAAATAADLYGENGDA